MKHLIRLALLVSLVCLLVAAYQLAIGQGWNSRLVVLALAINGLVLGYHNQKVMKNG